MKRFALPDCGRDEIRTLKTSKNPQQNIFLDRQDSNTNEKLLQIVNLSDLFYNVSSNSCTPVADVYFGKYKTYVYKIEKDNILKRWLLTPEGYEINPQVVVKTKSVCFSFD